MQYRFILVYKSTDSDTVESRVVYPIYGDDPNVSIDRENGEWYYTRKLNGKFTFERGDYSWIMSQAFDGTYTMRVTCSTDGTNWLEYFVGNFSQANLEVDLDNQKVTLDGLTEGTYKVIENARRDKYDLRKIIPDTEAKEVQGQIHPALALVDYRSENISISDVFCNGASTMGGYKSDKNDWTNRKDVRSNDSWNFEGVYADAKVKMIDPTSEVNGLYAGVLNYRRIVYSGHSLTSVEGCLTNENDCKIHVVSSVSSANYISIFVYLFDENGSSVTGVEYQVPGTNNTGYYNPTSLAFDTFGTDPVSKIDIFFHYIRATLLTMSADGVEDNVLATGPYYKGMRAFEGSGLEVTITTNTSDQPNGHRMVSGTDVYFAPPQGDGWHPLAEDNWNYASMWYRITPSVQNGLLDPSLVGEVRWTRCWTIGTCLKYLLDKISTHKVLFDENDFYSRFLSPSDGKNPVEGGEPFTWLVCQKSDVMNYGGVGATRCPVTLEWFLELLRNAFNCYWWLEKRNDGKYDFKVEHVEYFRKGHSYVDDPTRDLIDITKIKTRRNFLFNNEPAKRLSDQTNRYTFDLEEMVEKYTYAWQGEGGSDEFKGHPMFFKAGWIEAGSSDNREVDNIFADLAWLTLNAGTDTESSKNYDGLFIFAGYQRILESEFGENAAPTSRNIDIPIPFRDMHYNMWLTVPEGQEVTLKAVLAGDVVTIATYTGTGERMMIAITGNTIVPGATMLRLDFGVNYGNVMVHRVHGDEGNVYQVPNTESRLTEGLYIQNGPLAWPSLQCAYLHYDVPAAKWAYDSDDIEEATFVEGGTVKLIKKQDVGVLPVPMVAYEQRLVDGIRTGLGTGVLDSATVNLGSRNAVLTLRFKIDQ